MKKILIVLSVVSLMAMVGCNRDRSDDANMQQEESRGDVIEREEAMDYEVEDRLGEPVEDVEVERVEETRTIEE